MLIDPLALKPLAQVGGECRFLPVLIRGGCRPHTPAPIGGTVPQNN